MPAVTSLEMPLARQAVANAFGVLLLLAACGWLLHLTVECARQHWRSRKLQLAFEESKNPQRLLRKTLKTLAETPGFRVSRKNPRYGRADAAIPFRLNPQHPRILCGSGWC